MADEMNGQYSEHLLLVPFVQLSTIIIEQLQNRFPQAAVTVQIVDEDHPVPDDILRRTTVLVTMFYLPAPDKVPNLKLVHILSAGVDHVLSHPLVQRAGTSLTSSSGIHGPPIAEWVVMSWLVASRKYQALQKLQNAHTWGSVDGYLNGVQDQVGKHVGILGYGSIGRQVARVASALGMTVHAYTATGKDKSQERQQTGYIVPGTGDPEGRLPTSWHHGTNREALHKFLSIGLDHLVVAVPLTTQTTQLLGADEFNLLSKHCKSTTRPFMTNIGRGKVLDQNALVESLTSGEVSGAALDMTDPHPLPPEHPLWDVPNVQITPHISAMTQAYFPRSLDIVALNLKRIHEGLALVNHVRTDRGY